MAHLDEEETTRVTIVGGAGKDQLVAVLPKQFRPQKFSLSADGRFLALFGFGDEASVHIVDVVGGKLLANLGKRTADLTGMAFISASNILATSHRTNTVREWTVDVERGARSSRITDVPRMDGIVEFTQLANGRLAIHDREYMFVYDAERRLTEFVYLNNAGDNTYISSDGLLVGCDSHLQLLSRLQSSSAERVIGEVSFRPQYFFHASNSRTLVAVESSGRSFLSCDTATDNFKLVKLDDGFDALRIRGTDFYSGDLFLGKSSKPDGMLIRFNPLRGTRSVEFTPESIRSLARKVEPDNGNDEIPEEFHYTVSGTNSFGMLRLNRWHCISAQGTSAYDLGNLAGFPRKDFLLDGKGIVAVVSRGVGSTSIYDSETGRRTDVFPEFMALVVTSDGKYLVRGSRERSCIDVLDVESADQRPIFTWGSRLFQEGLNLAPVCWTRNLVGCVSNGRDGNTVRIIDLTERGVVASVAIGGQPIALAFTRSGDAMYGVIDRKVNGNTKQLLVKWPLQVQKRQ